MEQAAPGWNGQSHYLDRGDEQEQVPRPLTPLFMLHDRGPGSRYAFRRTMGVEARPPCEPCGNCPEDQGGGCGLAHPVPLPCQGDDAQHTSGNDETDDDMHHIRVHESDVWHLSAISLGNATCRGRCQLAKSPSNQRVGSLGVLSSNT